MATISINSANLAANTRTGNIIAGDPNEFLAYPALVNVYQVSSASGIRTSIYADTDVNTDDKEILAIGTSVDTSAHLVASFEVEAGTRLSVFLRETANVATTDVLTLIDIQPLQ